MANTIQKKGFISKKAPESKAEDFSFLRNLGVETLQKLSGEKWTDYNLHDPGITILEILAYAITEAGLKVNHPIENLLEGGEGEYNDLYTPSEILPSLPVTEIDFRKLLVDQPDIRNAWIIEHTGSIEPKLHFDKFSNVLNYSFGDQVKLKGFSDVLIEFEDSALNTNILKTTISSSAGNEYNLEIVFPYWDELNSRDIAELEVQSVNVQTVPGTGGSSGVPERKLEDNGDGNYFAVLELSYTGGFNENFGIHIKSLPEITQPADISELIDYKGPTDPGAITELFTDTSMDSLIQVFISKINKSKNLIADVRLLLNNYRNLCEDFYSYKTIRTQEIGINADIDLMVGAEAETVLARVFFEVNHFISPLIKFKSYNEMLAAGYTTEEIFEGPLLENGFLPDEDLILNERVDHQTGEILFYTSDLFNKIKSLNESKLEDKNHIIDLRNFSLSNYINNQVVTQEARNCLKLSLSQTYKPKLSILKSNVRLFKEGIEVEFDIDSVLQKYDEMVAEELAGLLSHPTDILQIPEGKKTDISEFNTIQNDFPLTYGIGEEGLPANATDERKAQAKQLKEYLLLFEQMLLNFSAQLNHIKELFSYNTSTNRTYFYELFHDIPLLDELVESSYYSDIKDITEEDNSQAQLIRRNKFLNHLVARVGEYRENFELLFLDDYQTVQHNLVDLKKKMLTNYQNISSNRFKAFNYSLTHSDGTPDVWNTQNVSGYEKRVCHLLALQDCKRRHLYNPVLNYVEFYQETDTDSVDEKRFRLRNKEGNILLSSSKKYTDESLMLEDINSVIRFGNSSSNYRITGSPGDFYFRLENEKEGIIARRIEPFATKEEVKQEIAKLIEFIGYTFIGEGFHVIEHLLLRPWIKGDISHKFMPVWFNNDDRTIFKDPYSFQMTVIIPSGFIRDFTVADDPETEITGLERFRDKDFRRIMERTLRDESPAHVFLHIISLDVDSSESAGSTPSLNNFEMVYRRWLETNADPASSFAELLTAHNNLLDVLNAIYNPA